ncbi:MAG: hypothetical protein WC456_04925 [Patescibacteria group bacterium]
MCKKCCGWFAKLFGCKCSCGHEEKDAPAVSQAPTTPEVPAENQEPKQ